MKLEGSCHCGAVQLELHASKSPEELPVRVCTCTFCRRAGGRYTSDPAGELAITVREPDALGRYRFGLELADFLFCRRCGSFVAAFEPGEPDRAVLNINVLADADRFVAAPTSMTYDAEDEVSRRTRRARNWTPARIG